MTVKTLEGFARQAGEGKKLDFLGDHTTCKVVASESGGSMTVVETMTDSESGPPPHIHEREDEAFYILEGEYEFNVAGKTVRAKPGTFLFSPRGEKHSFRNVSKTASKMIVVVSPSGLERCFEELAQLPPGPPDIPKVVAICKKYGVAIIVP